MFASEIKKCGVRFNLIDSVHLLITLFLPIESCFFYKNERYSKKSVSLQHVVGQKHAKIIQKLTLSR